MSSNSKSNNMKFEYNFLSKLIKLDKTIIGICLGAQIIAKFFGSKISKSKKNFVEIGYRELNYQNKNFFKGVKKLLQFHNEGINYNKHMDVLAKGRLFEIDAFKIKIKKEYMDFSSILKLQVNDQNWYSNLTKKLEGTDDLKSILKDHKKNKDINYNWMSRT